MVVSAVSVLAMLATALVVSVELLLAASLVPALLEQKLTGQTWASQLAPLSDCLWAGARIYFWRLFGACQR